MECKGCSKEFAESELKKVGLWNFCPPCFEKLLADAAEPQQAPAPEPESEPETPPLVLKGEQARCTVCDAILEDGVGHDMGILTVCTACYQELITRPEPIKINVAKEEVVENEEPDLPWPDPMETLPCTQCKRIIKKVAAKVFYDKPYCPDCYYKNDFQNFEG